LSTDVSEVRAASIIIALIMEAARNSETSVDNYFTRQYIPEDKYELHTRRLENLKSHIIVRMFTILNKIFPDYQPCQLVKRRKNRRFKDHLCPRLQDTDVSVELVRDRYKSARVPRS
jgi:hypothetical protein